MKRTHRRGESRPQTEVRCVRRDVRECGVLKVALADVIDMLDKMIKAVDEELLEDGLMSIGDSVLPHIQHWDRLAALLRDKATAAVTILPLVLGVSALTIVAVVAIAPIYLSFQTYK
ncbi:hypothetical protein OG21DRAFT_172175 [Imleria badia]|nr:hypothetical protein OG21DRAFT_172175 [Imleria badia]